MGKTVAIMQPYFLPYMGYWQLINATDEFVVYDNIQYTKKGWINRNRFLQNGKDEIFSLPLKSDSDFLDVADRDLSPAFDREKLVRQLQGAYRKAPYYAENFPVIEAIIRHPENNLSAYINHSIETLCGYLGINTKITKSSEIEIDHKSLKGQDKVISICKALDAQEYINPIGGLDLYDRAEFERQGLNLTFLRSRALPYKSFDATAIPHMSILDVLMFNSLAQVQGYLTSFDRE